MDSKSIDQDEEDLFIGETVFNEYKLLKKIGQGSFGSIYEAESLTSKKFYAIKLEDMKQNQNILEEESIILSYLNMPRVPRIKSFGYKGTFIILVMELLGKSLDKIFNELPSKKMSLRCVCNIALQLLSILEIMHNNNVIHRDIKPGNISIGIKEKSKYIYLLDFGLSKKYIDEKTNKHYNFEKNNKLIGNARYSSINALEGGTQSRRDDLESLGYLLLFFLLGRLPWQGYVSNSKEDKYYKITEIKKKTTAKELCENLPKQFEEYIIYTRNLKYEAIPDYNYLKNLFHALLKQNNWPFDYYYDWDVNKVYNTDIKDKKTGNQIPKICNKIKGLINERKKIGNFDDEKFVVNSEEDYNEIENNKNENLNIIKNSNNSNNLTENNGSIKKEPIKPRRNKEDSVCCIIY